MSLEKPDKPEFAIRAAWRSDVGMRRSNNQDAVAVAPAPNGEPVVGDMLMMVADGMGAHAAGELASKMAVDTIPHTFAKCGDESAAHALRDSIREANKRIHAKGASDPEFTGMGTTCSCLVITDGAGLVGHVGDSRVYRFRGGVLEQLTFDHSLVWEMAAASNVSQDKVPSFIPKNVITRSLGPNDSINVDLEGPHGLCSGDVFLLCSDGLTGVVEDAVAGGVLAALEPDAAAEALIDLANLRGGPDNISVVVARVESGEGCGVACAWPAPPSQQKRERLALAAAGVFAVACAVASFYGSMTMTIASAAGLGAAVFAYLAAGYVGRPGATPRLMGGAYGNGPYRKTECGDAQAAAVALRELVAQLASLSGAPDDVAPGHGANGQSAPAPVALSSGVVLDWSPHAAGQQAADAAFQRGDFADAARRFAVVVRAVLASLQADDNTERFKAMVVD